jgi:hypothetical protein
LSSLLETPVTPEPLAVVDQFPKVLGDYEDLVDDGAAIGMVLRKDARTVHIVVWNPRYNLYYSGRTPEADRALRLAAEIQTMIESGRIPMHYLEE